MQGFLPPIFSSVSHHKDNRSLQVWLGIETDYGNVFSNPISAGQWPRGNRFSGVIGPAEIRLLYDIGEYVAKCETAIDRESEGLINGKKTEDQNSRATVPLSQSTPYSNHANAKI
jgi:hypothetical protein